MFNGGDSERKAESNEHMSILEQHFKYRNMSEREKKDEEAVTEVQSQAKILLSRKLQIPEEEDDVNYKSDNSEDSEFSTLTGLSELSGQEWKPITCPLNWVQKLIHSGVNPREILSQILSTSTVISPSMNDMSLWRILARMLTEPPRRQKLRHINTIADIVQLLKSSENIIVLTGAGVSVSCGIPDFRSNDGIYSRLAKDFPGLPDPQAMFDINYFAKDPRPFYKFAREIYPGQFTPSPCHRFIKLLEAKGKLLRNYTQNIDTLEQVAGIRNVIECHGSFATASCTKCDYKTTSKEIRDDIFEQRIPLCPKCQPEQQIGWSEGNEGGYSELVRNGIMKPDIVFFGEGLPDAFHSAMAHDKDKCDLLIVIGSSLKVHPVALIPRSVPADIPQVLINREQLCHLEFDVELLGDSDTIINQLCHILGNEWREICWNTNILTESRLLKSKPIDNDEKSNSVASAADTDSQSTKSAITSNSSSGGFCDSGFDSSSSSNIVKHSRCYTKQSIPKQSSNNTDSDMVSLFENDSQTDQLEHFQQKMSENANLRHLSIDSSKDSGICEMSSSSCSNQIITPEEEAICEGNDSQDVLQEKSSGYNNVDNAGNETYVWLQKPSSSTQNIADRLCENTYYRHSSSGIYVFPGAQIYWSSDSESESSDDTDGDDDRSGGDNDNKQSSSTHNDKVHRINQNDDEDDDSPPIKRRRSASLPPINSSAD